ncbi:MAG: 50S ribosomal protein L14 [Candidatus Woesearchaeota archaeon]
MKALKAQVSRALPIGSLVDTCDNSGAKVVRIIGVYGHKTVRRRLSAAGVGSLVNVSVVKGRMDMRKQMVRGVVVRQKKEFRRPDGMRIKFEDNAIVILKDDKTATPKGTIFKGPIAKEAADRWPGIAKVASIVV